MVGEREVQPVRCEKCNGTGRMKVFMPSGASITGPCDHLRRTDVTGPTEDEIRIARLEDDLRDLGAAAGRLVAEVDECKALLESIGCERVSGTPLINMVREVVAMVKA